MKNNNENKTLLVIGNGWDLYKNLNITYSSFRDWIEKKYKILQSPEYISFNKLPHEEAWIIKSFYFVFENYHEEKSDTFNNWNELETAIKNIFEKKGGRNKLISDYSKSFNTDIELFYKILLEEFHFLKDAFKEFIKEKLLPENIDILRENKAINFLNDLFTTVKHKKIDVVNFNYTSLFNTDNHSFNKNTSLVVNFYNIHGTYDKEISFGTTIDSDQSKLFNIDKMYQKMKIKSHFKFEENYNKIFFFGFSFSENDYYFLEFLYDKYIYSNFYVINYKNNHFNYIDENIKKIYKSLNINKKFKKRLFSENRIEIIEWKL